MISEETFFGGAQYWNIVTTPYILRLRTGAGRIVVITGTEGPMVFLPTVRDIPPKTGGPVFYIISTNPNNFTIYTAEGYPIHTMVTNTMCVVTMVDRDGDAADWQFKCSPLISGTTTGSTTGETTTTTTFESTFSPMGDGGGGDGGEGGAV